MLIIYLINTYSGGNTVHYLTIKETAEKLGKTEKTIYNWLSRDYIPGAKKEGTTWLIPEDFDGHRDRRKNNEKYDDYSDEYKKFEDWYTNIDKEKIKEFTSSKNILSFLAYSSNVFIENKRLHNYIELINIENQKKSNYTQPIDEDDAADIRRINGNINYYRRIIENGINTDTVKMQCIAYLITDIMEMDMDEFYSLVGSKNPLITKLKSKTGLYELIEYTQCLYVLHKNGLDLIRIQKAYDDDTDLNIFN